MPKSDRDYLLERMERYLRKRATADAAVGGNDDLDDAPPPPSLTISRQCGVGLSRIERPLLEYLDSLESGPSPSWALFDQSILGRVVDDGRLPKSAPPFLSERTKFPVTSALRDRLALPQKDWTLFNHSANAIRQICRAGQALVVGRAGNFVTSDFGNTFHVRLIADKSNRIAFVSKRYRIDARDASELVEETDKARARFVKRHAGAEIDDAVAYHLVVNMDHFDDDVTVRVIADSMHEWAEARVRSSGPEGASRQAPSRRPGNVIAGDFPAAPPQ
jgi:cytidylate kinase